MSEKDNRIIIVKSRGGRSALFVILEVKKHFTAAQIVSYTLVKHIRDRICKQFYYTDPAFGRTVSE